MAAALPGLRVLLVEDDPRMAALLERGLAKEGAAVAPARTGREALAAARARRFDVVLLDVMLPDVDGFEVVRRLRAGEDPVPVLMLTARGEVEDRVAGLEQGADDYL